ncbi:ABC transporter ATP-binding protein [Anaeromyxobacter terrae]|uniref:ABC transporter ATP-binding protein n=1 Tax=Anaeromyxobacter terrae TaxID=2925406 RepID=UPI001F58DABA|nr:ABC transporter ATP-binding protein [Anaeromyxobacter sp. SG22]
MGRALSLDVERRFDSGPVVRARAELPLAGGLVTVLFGPSGSGKTTVLRLLAGLERPDAGAIRLDGETWADATTGAFVPPQRRGVGLLFQDHALFPHLTVAGNVAFGLSALPRAERDARVRELAVRMRIEELLDRRPAALSGGQRQRAALARALAPRPRLLLLDEPLSALDAPTRELLRGELRGLLESSGVPSIVVTHDRTEALALGDRMVVLAQGGVRQIGPVHEVFSAPADVEVARIVGTENVLPVRIAGREGGLATVLAGAVVLVGVDPGGVAGEAYACVRAEDVVLEDAAPHGSSAQNRLPGVVVARVEEGPLVRVAVDCGARLVALVTRRSADALALVPGRAIVARVKAPSVRIVPRAPAADG